MYKIRCMQTFKDCSIFNTQTSFQTVTGSYFFTSVFSADSIMVHELH